MPYDLQRASTAHTTHGTLLRSPQDVELQGAVYPPIDPDGDVAPRQGRSRVSFEAAVPRPALRAARSPQMRALDAVVSAGVATELARATAVGPDADALAAPQPAPLDAPLDASMGDVDPAVGIVNTVRGSGSVLKVRSPTRSQHSGGREGSATQLVDDYDIVLQQQPLETVESPARSAASSSFRSPSRSPQRSPRSATDAVLDSIAADLNGLVTDLRLPMSVAGRARLFGVPDTEPKAFDDADSPPPQPRGRRARPTAKSPRPASGKQPRSQDMSRASKGSVSPQRTPSSRRSAERSPRQARPRRPSPRPRSTGRPPRPQSATRSSGAGAGHVAEPPPVFVPLRARAGETPAASVAVAAERERLATTRSSAPEDELELGSPHMDAEFVSVRSPPQKHSPRSDPDAPAMGSGPAGLEAQDEAEEEASRVAQLLSPGQSFGLASLTKRSHGSWRDGSADGAAAAAALLAAATLGSDEEEDVDFSLSAGIATPTVEPEESASAVEEGRLRASVRKAPAAVDTAPALPVLGAPVSATQPSRISKGRASAGSALSADSIDAAAVERTGLDGSGTGLGAAGGPSGLASRAPRGDAGGAGASFSDASSETTADGEERIDASIDLAKALEEDALAEAARAGAAAPNASRSSIGGGNAGSEDSQSPRPGALVSPIKLRSSPPQLTAASPVNGAVGSGARTSARRSGRAEQDRGIWS